MSAVVLVALAGLTGCSAGPVDIDSPQLAGSDLSACRAFVAALPASLAGEDPRDVSPSDALGAAYGSPPITVTCGVAVPSDYAPGASCEVANGVGWYVPQADYDDQQSDVTMTAVGFRPVVQLHIPHSYRPDGTAAAIAQLATDVTAHLRLVERCT